MKDFWYRVQQILTLQPFRSCGYEMEKTYYRDGRGTEAVHCADQKAWQPFAVRVLGTPVRLRSHRYCKRHAEQQLNQDSILCNSCRLPILPGMRVGLTHPGEKYPYSHLSCGAAGAHYCGRWGEGRLVTLHELKPDQFPEGTITVYDHMKKTGQMVIIERN